MRLELALAFYLKEEDDQLAREHFERALVGRPPEALVANINRFVSTMRARRRWRGYFGFSHCTGYQYQRRVGRAVHLHQRPAVPPGGKQGMASSDIGVVGWGGGEYQFPLAARWRLRTGIDLNHREYKGSRFDQTYAGVYVGPRWLINRNTEMSLLATTSQRWFGGSSFNYDYGARLEVEHRVFAGLRLSGRALWSDRTYQQQKFLEGPLMVFSLGANYVPFPIMSGQPAGGLSAAGCQGATPGPMPGTGRAWARTWRCRGAFPWASAASSGGRITRASGRRSFPIILPAQTRSASCEPRC